MSLAPQALERSVLERKERDELAAIAEAMGVKPSARASKTTLIDQILREAGIETAEDRPKRARPSRSAATAAAAAAPAAVGNGAGPGSPNGSPSAVMAPPQPDTVPGTGPDGPVTIPADPDEEPAAPAPDPGGPTRPDEPPAPEPGTSGADADGMPGLPPNSPLGATGAGTGPSPTTSAPGEANGRAADDGQPAPGQGSGDRSGPGGGARTDDRHRSRDPRTAAYDNGGDGNRRSSRRRRGRDRSDRVVTSPQQGGTDEVVYSGEPIPAEGLLDLHEKGYGFLRTTGYLASPKDVYVSVSQVRRFGLRKGDYVKGASRPAGSNEAWPALLRIDTVSGMTPDEARSRPKFEELTPLFPDQRLRLEVPGEPANMVARIVDLISPIGKGQRGLIVSPPKAGKTTVLKQIAHSIEANNPEV
ncbi:MAG: hypothetical protein ABR511_07070, partial [Acidimicrobiales bacterium]